ncbi:MAG: hypothetical protein AAGK97_15565, partial [Bacteroidota bacterium]
MKKYFIALLLLSLFIAGCQKPATDDQALPDDLTALKALQKEEKDKIRSAELRLDSIELKIAELDPNTEKKKRLVTSKKFEKTDFN